MRYEQLEEKLNYINNSLTAPVAAPVNATINSFFIGNGVMGVSIGGGKTAPLDFYINRSEFIGTMDEARSPTQFMTFAAVSIDIPEITGGSFYQEEDLYNAGIKGVYSKDDYELQMYSRVDSN